MRWRGRKGEDAEPAPASPQLSDLNPAEREWIAENVAALAQDDVDVEDAAQMGRRYDQLLIAWQRAREDEQADPNPDIDRIGLGLGEHLVRRAGLEWVIASDDGGTEIAVHGEPGDILIHPTNAVAKRWVDGVSGWLPEFADQIVAAVERIRRGEHPRPD